MKAHIHPPTMRAMSYLLTVLLFASAWPTAHAFSEKVRARYKGRVPLYDFGKILSDDFRSGHAYCPEYSSDPAGVHPNLEAGQEMMAKAFLLIVSLWVGQNPRL